MRALGGGIALAVLALTPVARGAPLQTFDNGTPAIWALHGWVVWSTLEPSGWTLTALHDGTAAPLRVRPRPANQPFDLDLGTDSNGQVVATYSRCAHYQPTIEELPYGNHDCSIRVLDLATQAERPAAEPRARHMSDTTPSMWNGRIAFSRYRDGSAARAQVAQLYIWSPRTGRLVPRRHGALLHCRTFDGPRCDNRNASGFAATMDLGDRLLAYQWYQLGPGNDHPEIELRADDAAGHSLLMTRGIIGEACGGVTALPHGVTVEGTRVRFGYTAFDCQKEHALVERYDTVRRRLTKQVIGRPVLDFAFDGATSYGLFFTPVAGEEPCSPKCSCTLETF